MTKAAAAHKPPPDDDGIESTTAEQLRKLHDMSDIIFLIDGYTKMSIAPSFLQEWLYPTTAGQLDQMHEKVSQNLITARVQFIKIATRRPPVL